jgi:O-antigen ligase
MTASALRPAPAGFAPEAGTLTVPAARVNPVVRGALYVYLLSIPFEISQGRTIPVDVPTLTGSLFLLTTLLDLRACYRRIPAAAIWFLTSLWILAVLAVRAAVIDEYLVTQELVLLLEVILLLVTVYNLLADPRIVRGVLIAVVVSTAARAAVQVLGIATTRYEEWGGGERVTAFGQNANLSAAVLSVGLVILVGFRGRRAPWLPRFAPLLVPFGLVLAWAIIQGGSRGGLLCALLGLATFALAPGQSVRRRLRNLTLCLLVGGGVVGAALQTTIWKNRIKYAEQGNLAGREYIYPGAIEMITERPVLGWGPEANHIELARRLMLDKRKWSDRDPHNLYLELLTSSGVIGTIPFLIGIGLCLRGAWRARRGPLHLVPLALLATVLTLTMSGTWALARILWLAFSVALAGGTHWAGATPPAWRRVA